MRRNKRLLPHLHVKLSTLWDSRPHGNVSGFACSSTASTSQPPRTPPSSVTTTPLSIFQRTPLLHSRVKHIDIKYHFVNVFSHRNWSSHMWAPRTMWLIFLPRPLKNEGSFASAASSDSNSISPDFHARRSIHGEEECWKATP